MQKLLKIKREPSMTFCEYCGESRAVGGHGIAEDLAKPLGTATCKNGHTEVLASCVLGLGHFSYYCEKCGTRWSNI